MFDLTLKLKAMLKSIKLCVLSLLILGNVVAQEEKSKSTIAVALPNIENIELSREIVAKLIQIELIKLDGYRVYDEFDIQEAMNAEQRFKEDCYGRNCLVDLGKTAGVNYIVSTSLLSFGGKIVITMKFIDVASGNIVKNDVREFIDNRNEVQRMLKIMIMDMHDQEVHSSLISKISYDDKPIVKTDVGRINNSGPRVGYALLNGKLTEFAERPENQGGLDIFPGVSMIGYQVEKQYIGTENFSALGELLFTVSGLEQGVFIPSVTLMNGLRFGKAGWEIAFGPGFGVSRYSEGFFDTEGIYGAKGRYWTEKEFRNDIQEYDEYGEAMYDLPYETESVLDARGNTWKLTTRWVMGFGRTFRAGALNIPVNIFYSSMKNSSMFGVSVGFNVIN